MTKNNIIEIPSDDDNDFPFALPIRGLPWKPPKDFVPNSDGEWMTKNNIIEIPPHDAIDFSFAPPIRGLHWKPPKDFVPNLLYLYVYKD